MGEISGLSYGVRGSDQATLNQALLPKLQELLITLTSLFSFLRSRLDKYASSKSYYADNEQGEFQTNWKPFKKVTSKADGENGFSQVHYHFSDKFSTSFIYDVYQDILYHIGMSLSTSVQAHYKPVRLRRTGLKAG